MRVSAQGAVVLFSPGKIYEGRKSPRSDVANAKTKRGLNSKMIVTFFLLTFKNFYVLLS